MRGGTGKGCQEWGRGTRGRDGNVREGRDRGGDRATKGEETRKHWGESRKMRTRGDRGLGIWRRKETKQIFFYLLFCKFERTGKI